MADWLERTELLLGSDKMDKLSTKHVLIVGLGGIGSFAAEFIARAGIGEITLIDGDKFDPTNKNRQLTALDSTIGKNKAVVLSERIQDISKEIKVNILEEFVEPERVWTILNDFQPDYVMDCIDSVSPKVEWIIACKRLKIKIITHLGAGGKTDPSKVQMKQLMSTHDCKLGFYLKKRLKQRKVEPKGVKAIFSSEIQQKHALKLTDGTHYKRSFYGTVSYIPALFGLLGAAEVIRYLSESK